MPEETPILNFNDAINALNSVSNSFKIEVWIPSIQNNVSFKEIDAKQQKAILGAAIDNSVYAQEFNNTFYDILKENILNEDKSIVDSFTISDKAFIAIALRSQISDDLSVKFDDDSVVKVSLQNFIDVSKKYISPSVETIEIKNDSVTLNVEISIPTVKTELEYDENFKKLNKNINDIKTEKEIKTIVTDAFISETSKYIKSVKVNDSKFDFATLTVNQKIQVVEKLPSGLIQKILEKLSDWKKDIDKVLTVNNGDQIKVISIDSLLFLS
jgi:hypothetical protein